MSPHETGIPEPAATESGTAPPGADAIPDPVVGTRVSGQPGPDRPQTTALAALLTCGYYLPIGRARGVLAALAGIPVSSGFMADARGEPRPLLDTEFLPHLRALLPTAVVLHADEITGRAAEGRWRMCMDMHRVLDVDARRRALQRRHR